MGIMELFLKSRLSMKQCIGQFDAFAKRLSDPFM